MMCRTDFGDFSRDAHLGRNGGRGGGGLARMFDSQKEELKSPHLTTKLQSYISYRAARKVIKPKSFGRSS